MYNTEKKSSKLTKLQQNSALLPSWLMDLDVTAAAPAEHLNDFIVFIPSIHALILVFRF